MKICDFWYNKGSDYEKDVKSVKERWKTIRTGLVLVIASVLGLWEYIQLFQYYDVPQAIVVLPIVGCVTVILCRKFSFVLPVTTMALAAVYQFAEKEVNTLGIVETSKVSILLNLLPFLVLFLGLGIGGGFLIRVLLNGEKSKTVGIVCCIFGVILTLGGGIFMFGNPLYPFVAKYQINQYAQKFEADHDHISEVKVYYSYDELQYQGQVVMLDGVIYALYHDKESGEVTEAK